MQTPQACNTEGKGEEQEVKKRVSVKEGGEGDTPLQGYRQFLWSGAHAPAGQLC